MASFQKLSIIPCSQSHLVEDYELHALKGGASGAHTGQIRVIKAVINKKAISEPVVFPSLATRSEREAINRICLSSKVNSLSFVLSSNCWSSILFSKTERILDTSVEETQHIAGVGIVSLFSGLQQGLCTGRRINP